MAKYQGTYSTEYSQGSVDMVVEANSTFHAEELIKAQTGATEVYNIGAVTDNNSPSTVSGYTSFNMGFLPTVIIGGIVLYGLSIFGGNVQQSEPTQDNNNKMEYVQPNNTQIQYSSHHKDTTIPQFFNTNYQEDSITDLGQTWDQ